MKCNDPRLLEESLRKCKPVPWPKRNGENLSLCREGRRDRGAQAVNTGGWKCLLRTDNIQVKSILSRMKKVFPGSTLSKACSCSPSGSLPRDQPTHPLPGGKKRFSERPGETEKTPSVHHLPQSGSFLVSPHVRTQVLFKTRLTSTTFITWHGLPCSLGSSSQKFREEASFH